MSHNNKYYCPKIRKIDAKGSKTIAESFFNIPKVVNPSSPSGPETSFSQSETTSVSNNTENDDVNVEKSNEQLHTETPTSSSVQTVNCQNPVKNVAPDRRVFDSAKYERCYSWLYYNIGKGGYMCKFCELFPFISMKTNSKWGQVGVDLKENPTRRLEKHNDSQHHKQSTERYKAAHDGFFSKSKKQTVYQQIKDYSSSRDERLQNRETLKKMFRVVYYISRRYWSQSSYGDIVRFMAEIGVEDFANHLQNAPSYATYLSDGTSSEMINFIGEHIERKLITSIRKDSFFTLLADESADEKNREQMTVFIKWPSSTDNFCHFAGIIHVERADAESLMTAIQTFCIAKGLDLTKCRFVGFDGANVMSGEVSGLQRRIRHVSPLCLYMNCRNHRLALCLKHLIKEYPLLSVVDETLLAIWKLFHYSPRRFAVFQNVQAVYGDRKITLIRAAATRWLSHGKATVRFIDRYGAILDALDQLYDEKHEPEVHGLRATITKQNTVLMILLLCDVLKPVNVLSESLQKADINFMDVDSKVKATLNELEEIEAKLQNRNVHTDMYFSKCDQILEEITERTVLQRRIRGDVVLDPETFIREKAGPFINGLKGEIMDAFVCHPVFKAFQALDPRQLPENLDHLPDHGKVSMETLVRHYGEEKEDKLKRHITRCPPDVDSAELLRAEYAGFKHQMFMFRQNQRQNQDGLPAGPYELQAKMNDDPVLRTCFPRIYKLVQLMCIIPTSTAAVERGFSVMNLLCTPERSSFLQTKLSSLMMICVEGPNELSNEDLELLCDTFRNAKVRKLAL